jgi:hypothetical protein
MQLHFLVYQASLENNLAGFLKNIDDFKHLNKTKFSAGTFQHIKSINTKTWEFFFKWEILFAIVYILISLPVWTWLL